jgi:hypothetical protein
MIALLMEINDYEIGFEGNGIHHDTMARRTFGRCHLVIDFKQYCEIYFIISKRLENRDTFQCSSYNLSKY